jgi:hypothetical protein
MQIEAIDFVSLLKRQLLTGNRKAGLFHCFDALFAARSCGF